MNSRWKLPEAMIFDLGDTVFHTLRYDRKAGIRALLSHAGIALDDGQFYDYAESSDSPKFRPLRGIALVDALAKRGEELDRRLEDSCDAEKLEYRQRDYHRLLYGLFGIELGLPDEAAEQVYWNASLETELEPGIEEFIQELSRRGVRMAVISNAVYSSAVLQAELERRGLLRHFEFVLSSADYGLRKPDPLLFSLALGYLKLRPQQCLYAGNLPNVDVKGALDSSWRAAWYAASAGPEDASLKERLVADGVYVWGSWEEALGLIED